MHGPTFYENADPVPRGVEHVTCSAPLQGEWIMNPDPTGFTWPGHKKKHRASITAGADLILNPDAMADSTFGGAIKFIYAVPTREELYSLHPPWYSDSGKPYTTETDEIRKKFGGRRTWTNQDPLFKKDKKDKGELSMWTAWNDYFEYPPALASRPKAQPAYHAAVQRVLNEFDWETWRAHADDVNPGAPPPWVKEQRCILYSSRTKAFESYPHPYYDATCIGIDAEHGVQKDHPYNLVDTTVISRRLQHTIAIMYNQLDAYFPFSVLLGEQYTNGIVPITGRCKASLWNTNGFGSPYNYPPKCDAFFNLFNEVTLGK